MAQKLSETSTEKEIALEGVRQKKLENLIQIMQLPRFSNYSDDVRQQIIDLSGIKANRRP